MRQVLREPLLHFLIAGACLFLAFELLRPNDAASGNQIRVNQDALVQYIRHRDPRMNQTAAIAAFDSMTPAQRDTLVEQFVREEVLFRQARALGLEKCDHAGRRRLVAQLDYINRGLIEETLQVSDDELLAFYAANSERYFEAPTITFTHVYFSAERSREQARHLAAQALSALNRDAVPFHRGAAQGDRFLYHKNYVRKGLQEIESHFDAGFAEAVFGLPASDSWTGPLVSKYGYHVVMVTSQIPGFVPPFAEVRGRVIDDLAAERVAAELESYYRESRAAYDIVVDLQPASP